MAWNKCLHVSKCSGNTEQTQFSAISSEVQIRSNKQINSILPAPPPLIFLLLNKNTHSQIKYISQAAEIRMAERVNSWVDSTFNLSLGPMLIKNIQHSNPVMVPLWPELSVTRQLTWDLLTGWLSLRRVAGDGTCCYDALLFRCWVCSGFTWYS